MGVAVLIVTAACVTNDVEDYVSSFSSWLRGSLLLGVSVVACAVGSDEEKPGNSELRNELLAMVEADQALRADLSPERIQDTAFLSQMLNSQLEHQARMWEILGEHGWPGADLVGADGAQAAWLLVQHGDADLQEEALTLMQESTDAGVTAANIAMMTDRILVKRGRPQLYGTQFKFVDGNLVQDPVDDPDSVDVRRAEVGLPPMDEYVRMLEEAYGVKRE
jgi:hypothetical protein